MARNIKSTGQAMEVTPSSGTKPDRMSTWVQDERSDSAAPAAPAKPKVKYALPGDVAADVRKAFIGTSYMREKMVMTLTRAAEAYDRKRYEEALRLGRDRGRRRARRRPGARTDRPRGLPRRTMEHGEDPPARALHHHGRL